jgi:hypothetical protein
MKPKLKGPGAKRFKLKCHQLLSNFAFKLDLRRYNQVDTFERDQRRIKQESSGGGATEVGLCRLTLSNPC